MQLAIPFMQLRGGSSKGIFLKATDLPSDEAIRNRLILAAMEGMGAGDTRQIDGLGGGTSLTSKVAVVSRSKDSRAALDFLFLQVVIGKGKVSATQSCGNILAGVVPFAIESGLLAATHPITIARVNLLNTGGSCDVEVETPNGRVNYAGSAKVDGVPGTAAPIICNYLDTEGSTCGSLLPTGQVLDAIDGIEVTCIDNGMPEIVLRATDLGLSGYETPAELDANEPVKKRLEYIRLILGPRMNLGDVAQKTIPKMCLVSPPRQGGAINTRTFIPHSCHEAIGVLGAVSTATACLLPGAVTDGIAVLPDDTTMGLSVEHPLGEFTVKLEASAEAGRWRIHKSGVIRTARLLSKGELFIPDNQLVIL
jgi:4-oxalomesaconate tautomerase